MPQVQKFMSAMPHTVGRSQPVKAALELMRKYRIRHLPVQDRGKLLGIITDRDIKLASSVSDSVELTVEEVMTPDPYTARPEAPLDEVALKMAEHKYGCAIIQQSNGKIVGIFTSIDALRVLAKTLQEFPPKRGGRKQESKPPRQSRR